MEVKKTKDQNSSDLQHISQYLSTVEDFRIEKKCAHKLSDILFIGLLTFLSSGEDYLNESTNNNVIGMYIERFYFKTGLYRNSV